MKTTHLPAECRSIVEADVLKTIFISSSEYLKNQPGSLPGIREKEKRKHHATI